jgi:hypothetical protein
LTDASAATVAQPSLCRVAFDAQHRNERRKTEHLMADKATCATHGKPRLTKYMAKVAAAEGEEEGGEVRWACLPGMACPPDTENCDLCNRELKEGLEAHIAGAHRSLLLFADELEAGAAALRQTDVAPAVVVALGATARGAAKAADGGEAMWRFANAAHEQLSYVIKSAYPQATVFMFGSAVAAGTWDGEGDVDFTAVDADGWDNGTWPPTDEASIIRKINNRLKDAGFKYDDLEPVLHTRVPVAKHKVFDKSRREQVGQPECRTFMVMFNRPVADADITKINQLYPTAKWRGKNQVHVTAASTVEAVKEMLAGSAALPRSAGKARTAWASGALKPEMFQLDFDMTCRAHGVRNSVLLRRYLEQDHLARAGSVFVKKWGKRCGVNNSMRGYLTSYAVNIMWIHYLVRRRSLAFVAPTDVPKRPEDKKYDYMPMLPADVACGAAPAVACFDAELGELILGFFKFYAFDFAWDDGVISITSDGAVSKASLMWTLENEVQAVKFRDRVWYRMCIEDPFEENLNLARHVSPVKLKKIRSEFLLAVRHMAGGSPAAVLRSRTALGVEDDCRMLVARAMVGHQTMALDDLAAAARAADLPLMAAFEVEHQTRKLVDIAGFVIDDGVVCHDERRGGAKFVHASKQDLVTSLAIQLRMAGPSGVQASDGNADIAHLFMHHVSVERIFATADDCSAFQKNLDFAKKLLVKPKRSYTVADVAQRAAEALGGAYHEGAMAAVLTETPRMFVPRGPHVVAFEEPAAVPAPRGQAAPAYVAPKVTRSGAGMPGKACSTCRKNSTTVWATSNPQADRGLYCDDCWRDFN